MLSHAKPTVADRLRFPPLSSVTHKRPAIPRTSALLSGLFLHPFPRRIRFGAAQKMGRLPGGILDETRDYIIKELSGMDKSKLLKLSKTTQSSDVPGSVPTVKPFWTCRAPYFRSWRAA